jgi:hypothetical protein
MDDMELGLFSYKVFSQLQGAMTAAMIHLGDRLGLYRALAEAGEPLTTAELAERGGYDERWVREWAYNQGAAEIILIDADERLSLSEAGVAVLADDDSAAFGMGLFQNVPQVMGDLDRLPDAFRTGLGLAYDDHGRVCAEAVARGFEPWTRHHLIPTVIPMLDGVVERLDGGGSIIDVGCGAGVAVRLLAERFPAASVTGFDISQHALELARSSSAGVANVEFLDPRRSPMPTDGSVSLGVTLDCLHDMTDPASVVRQLRQAVADDGTWLLVDIKAHDTYAANAQRNPMAALMYGTSVLTCMSSALSEPGGAGLGTLGLSAATAEAMARDAGFSRFRQLDVDHPVNAFYEIRP